MKTVFEAFTRIHNTMRSSANATNMYVIHFTEVSPNVQISHSLSMSLPSFTNTLHNSFSENACPSQVVVMVITTHRIHGTGSGHMTKYMNKVSLL